jgi:hypothetical protein
MDGIIEFPEYSPAGIAGVELAGGVKLPRIDDLCEQVVCFFVFKLSVGAVRAFEDG